MGNLNFALWDCGGQSDFMKQYLLQQREQIFSKVEVLIYVFDVTSITMKDDFL
jgi:Ras-related GTP-binding protein A/B